MLAAATLATSGALAPLAARAEAGKGQFGYLAAPDGVPLCVFETGNPRGKELLLIHGFSQSYAVFKLQYEGPLAQDHRIVAFDLRGHGCSGKPWAESAYTTTRAWADDVDAVIRAKQLRNPLIVAWSFGGYVAVHYVEHHGTTGIAGVVLVGSNAGLPPAPTDPAAIARFEAAKRRQCQSAPRHRGRHRRGPRLRQGDGGQAAARGHGGDHVRHQPDAAALCAPRDVEPCRCRLDQAVPSMTAPVLLLVGDKDLSQSVETLSALARRLPDGRVKVLPGAGHAAFIDSPAEFDAAIREFEDYATSRH